MNEDRLKSVREAFTTTLRKKRNLIGISQEELGFRSGITMRYVSLLETGKRQPTITTIASICQALDISLSDFMIEVDELAEGQSK